MRLKELRGEATSNLAQQQSLNAAKQWIHAEWPEADWQEIVQAIRDGVATECVLRDNREHDIPLDGKLYNEQPLVDPTTGQKKMPAIRVDPRRKGLKHGHREVKVEVRRRLYELTARRPSPQRFRALLLAIAEDDGKDAEGQWLCNRCNSCDDPSSPNYPDGTGFDDRWPKWMDLADAKAEEPAPLAVCMESGQLKSGCPGCGGLPIGRGFRHTDECPEKPANRKKMEAAVPAGT